MVPTRNRPDSLARLLRALARQDLPPDQVIVVDAGDPPLESGRLRAEVGPLAITHVVAATGVCAQRNLGVRLARHRHVLLCDDDIEPPPDYLRKLAELLEGEPGIAAVSGLLTEPGPDGSFQTAVEVPSLRHLLNAFVFQLTVWGDVTAARSALPARPLLAALKRWYRRRGNTFSLAGWPLFTQLEGPVVRTALYGLGAALVRRDLLLRSPFDERLGPHGIGENYGVALGFPGDRPIAVLMDLPVRHHRAAANRLEPTESRIRRVLALDYFVRSDARFPPLTTVALAWSLVGVTLRLTLRGRIPEALRTARALAVVLTGRNPLLRGGAP